MAILLTIVLVEWAVQAGMGPARTLWLLAEQLVGGLLGGVALGLLLRWVLRRVHLEQQGLYPVVTMAGVVLGYAVTAQAGGSGFLATYVGLMLSNAEVAHTAG